MVIGLLDDYILCSNCVHTFGALAKAVGLFLHHALHDQPMFPKMCSIGIFVNHQNLAEI